MLLEIPLGRNEIISRIQYYSSHSLINEYSDIGLCALDILDISILF